MLLKSAHFHDLLVVCRSSPPLVRTGIKERDVIECHAKRNNLSLKHLLRVGHHRALWEVMVNVKGMR